MAVIDNDTILLVPGDWWDAAEDPPGFKFEIIRGELVVAASPNRAHQRASLNLMHILRGALPEGYEVSFDLEWRLDQNGYVAQAPRPDILVLPKSDEPVHEPPLLLVEVLSPSDSHRLQYHDLSRIEGKRLDYAVNGLRWYMEIEYPDRATLYRVSPGGLERWVLAQGDGLFVTTEPLQLSFYPRDLYI